MPVSISDQALQKIESVTEFIEKYPHFKDSAAKLTSQPRREVGPQGLLYVGQREFATTTPEDDSIQVMGAEDATTCHLTVLRHTGSGAVCLSHCDGSSVPVGIREMIGEVVRLSEGQDGRFELHVFGGFLDDRKISAGLFLEILNSFHESSEEIHLQTACTTDLNDVVKNGIHWPIIYGIGVDVKMGEIFPAYFPEKGPDDVARGARNMIGKDARMASIYDFRNRQLRIGPFQYAPWPDAKLWLSRSDEVILNCMSTSPKVEPPYFVEHMRAVLGHVIEKPSPTTRLFPDGKSRLYAKDDNGLWIKLDS